MSAPRPVHTPKSVVEEFGGCVADLAADDVIRALSREVVRLRRELYDLQESVLTLPNDQARTKLHRAKEILGSMYADLLPQHQAFWAELEELLK